MYNPPVTLAYAAAPSPAPVQEKPLDVRQISHFLLSNGPLILALTAVFVVTSIIYVLVTPPTFITNAQLMLEPQALSGASPQPSLAEEAVVEGQIEVMKSSEVLRAVVRKLELTNDPEFRSDNVPFGDLLRSLVGSVVGRNQTPGTTVRSPEERLQNYTVAMLRSRLWIRRVGQSTVIEIGAASSSPGKAAMIANNVAEQYIAQNVRMKSQAAFRSSEWLAQRVAALREAVFEADREVMRFRSAGDPENQFKLVELTSVAETSRRLYETYLQSWSEAKQRISYPVSDATFVSRAAVPVAKSHPKSMLIVGFALLLGLGFGVVVAIVRHMGTRFITSTQRLAGETGIRCLGEVTHASAAGAGSKILPEWLSLSPRRPRPNARERFDRDLRDLRATLGGLRRNGRASLIGLVATETKAGTTALAFNLARFASASGSKTLLIDASATNPTLSQMFGEDNGIGLMDILNDHHAYFDFISRLDKPLTVLPIGGFQDVTPGERIGSERIAFNLADLKEHFDLILVDLPPVSQCADAKSIGPHLDGILVVVRYGKSTFDAAVRSLSALREVGADVLGIVLNATPIRRE
jgi:uncharacterized protein involved in exopolysaccharide biosynthesis/Mrp family chromosome partitioning ATPase